MTGCRCETEHFNCAQGDLCPLRQPVKAPPRQAAIDESLRTAARIERVLLVGAIAVFASLVLAGLL